MRIRSLSIWPILLKTLAISTYPPEKKIAVHAKIIQYQVWRNPIVVSHRSGFIVKGQGRLLAARLLNLEQVPIDYQDDDNEASEWADMVADNRIAELVEIDKDELYSIVSALDGCKSPLVT